MESSGPSSPAISTARLSWRLGLSLCLIMAALYQVKPVCRTLFITYVGAEELPYIWLISTLVLFALVLCYHRLRRTPIVFHLSASCLSFARC